MFDVTALSLGSAVRGTQNTDHENRPLVARIGSATSSRASLDYMNAQTQKMPSDLEIHRARKLEKGGLTGPPPAFQASLLELQSDIRYVIKQLDAAREKASNANAVRAEPG